MDSWGKQAIQLNVKARVLLHLLEHPADPDAVVVSAILTQERIAEQADFPRRHFSILVGPLIRDGLVREWMAHVPACRQRRKVYTLTWSGYTSAARLRETLGSETIPVRVEGEIRNMPVAALLNGSDREISLVRVAALLQRNGCVDVALLRSSKPFVEMTSDAPRVEQFIGRRAELTEVLAEDERPRAFIVRGIAGIGKSCFAAKACDLVRGERNLFWHRVRPWESQRVILSNLGRFLSAVDRPGLASVLSRGEAGRASEVLRQDLPGTRSFLVFDDAHEASPDVMPVFRMLAEAVSTAPDVRVLILSREALPFYDRRSVVLESLVREIELPGLGTEEAAALLAPEGGSGSLAGLGRRLAGHPLFLELVRTHRPLTAVALRDVQRFLEEEIYQKLSDPERAIMKAICLYGVPIPQDVLLSIPGSSYAALLSLKNRSLIRLVRGDRYEIHDTIRDFFTRTLSSEERRAFGDLAEAQLRSLASKAWSSGDMIVCIDCLSNALLLSQSREDRADLSEALGDANERIGDLFGVTAAFREAMELTTDPEVLARLHRKLASALEDRGQLTVALAEVEAGFTSLEGTPSVERGWLDLMNARIANEDYNYEPARASAERAFRIFEQSGILQGKAEALLELGRSASWTGTATADEAPFAEHCLQSALELATSLDDPGLSARIHLAAASSIGYGSGSLEEGLKHYNAVESMPSTMTTPRVQALLHEARAWFLVRVALDFEAAEADLSEALRVARKIHDVQTIADVTYHSAFIAHLRGRYGEAARLFEEARLGYAQAGITGLAVDAQTHAAHNYLAEGDRDRYRRAVSVLREPKMAQALQRTVRLRRIAAGMEALVLGDVEGFEAALAEYFRLVEGAPSLSYSRKTHSWWGHFYYSVGLRTLGRKDEAAEQLLRARELLLAVNNRSGLHIIESDFAERMARTIREGRKVA